MPTAGQDKARIVPLWFHLGALGLLALFLWQTGEVADSTSATADEPIYIRSGLAILEEGDLTLNDISSPFLFKSLNALPLLGLPGVFPIQGIAVEAETWPPLLAQWRAGTELVRNLGPTTVLPLARLVPRLTGLATGLLLYLAAFLLFGAAAAWCGLALFLFLPEVTAHASLATLEAGLGLTAFFTLVLVERFFRGPRAVWAVVAGVGLGATLLTKTTGLVLALFLVCLWFFSWIRSREERPHLLRGFIALVLAAWLTVNGAFLFEGTLDPLAAQPEYAALEKHLDLLPAAAALKWAGRNLPVLLPRSMVHTLVTQVGIAGKGKTVFFNGRYSESGWVWFMPLVFLIKMPIPFLLLAGISIWLLRRARGPLLVFGGFALFLLAFFSLASRLNAGVRYLYPALPGLALLAGAALVVLAHQGGIRRALAIGLLAWFGLGAAWVHPHGLAYANEAAGGPGNLYRLLGDSNVDWGQDLPALARVLKAEGIPRVRLSYFGSDDPARYGIDYDPLPSIGLRPEPGSPWWFEEHYRPDFDWLPGVYAVSANNLNGLFFRDRDLFARLRNRTPDFRAGHSILLYDLRHPGDTVLSAENR